MFAFEVLGLPRSQGTARAFVVGGRARITTNDGKTRPWRQDIAAAALTRIRPGQFPKGTPVVVGAIYRMPRPQSHSTKRGVRPSAPEHPSGKPDVDKLDRALLDALTISGIWSDDSQVIALLSAKVYASRPGLAVLISDGARMIDVVINWSRGVERARVAAHVDDAPAKSDPQVSVWP